MTDDPDLERAARSVVDENGVWLYHENVNPTEHGFWVEAKDLRVGDVFLGANGELSTLINAVRVEQEGGIAVFNFTVKGNHNYYILAKNYEYGQTSVLVHNGKLCNGVSKDDFVRVKNSHQKNVNMSPHEREFVLAVRTKKPNLHIYRTKDGKGIGDFMIVDPQTNKGFLVELKQKAESAYKGVQLKNLEDAKAITGFNLKGFTGTIGEFFGKFFPK